ncbi:acetate--CoA ligase family protein, partial [Nocardioides sp.]|uniref:acetate--CoA ligase family protein n=1 Tax=Nocardioides sp. TaxID=35761 RepID=UPI002736C2F5
VVAEVLASAPEGRDLDQDEVRALLEAYGIDLWPAIPVGSVTKAQSAGRKLGWDVVLKATAQHLQQRPDLAHVWRNIDTPREMEDAWQTLNALITDPGNAHFVVQKQAPPGVPVAITTIEDPLFGPVVSFGVSGPLTELLQDKAFRIPPLAEQDAAEMIREIRTSPLLFGYRGAEVVDVAEVERLVRMAAQLQNDLPQVRSLDLSLVIAGAQGSTVLSATARVEPALDQRSDWFVRRLSTMPGDTLPS